MSYYEANNSYSSVLKEDNSDRKTLDMLLARIGKLDKKPRPEPERKSNRIKKVNSDYSDTKSVKESGISKSKVSGSSSKISNTKVKATLKDNGVTITDSPKWIKKDPSKSVRSRSKSKSSKEGKKDKWRQSKLTETFSKPLEKQSTKSIVEEKKKKKKTAEPSTSNVFEKYSMKTPTHDEIMAYRKQTQLEKEALEKLQKEMEDSLESDINFNIDESVVNEDVKTLDCKHLTDDEVNEYFNKNYKYMHEIHDGIRSTTRSDKFKKGGDTRDLRYNTTSCTFTYEQKKLMYSLLHDKFGDENFMRTNDQYFFQVLIPELCLKIFMDVHDMTLEKATDYLDNAPVKIRI